MAYAKIQLALLALVIAFGATLLSLQLEPEVATTVFADAEKKDQPARPIPYPFSEDSGNSVLTGYIQASITVPMLRATTYVVSVDDCLDWIEVNGARVVTPNLPYCRYSVPVVVEFGQHLRAGSNLVKFGFRNLGGPAYFRLRVSERDFYRLYAETLRVPALVVFFVLLAAILVVQVGASRWLAVPFLLGVALRIVYWYVTPYEVRGHDWGGHAEYIQKFAADFQIPSFKDGWQAYQPPLYYFFGSAVYRAALAWGADTRGALECVQFISLCTSIAMLYLSIVFLGWMPLVQRRQSSLIVGAFFLAVLPSLVMAGARINNDMPAHFLSLLASALLYRWWQTGSARTWFLSVVVLCLALLTKSTALAIVPLFGVCFVLARHVSLRTKGVLALGTVIMVYVLLGWYVMYRVYGDQQQHLVANVQNLSGGLRIDPSLTNLVVFNPAGMLREPYNGPWRDSARRAYLWEYATRGALFGEFDFGPDFRPYAQALLALTLILIMIAGWGMLTSLTSACIPIYLLLLSQLAAIAANRILYPYSCSQDFRYILPITVPWAYFVACGIGHMPKWLRGISIVALMFFVGLSCYFVVSLVR